MKIHLNEMVFYGHHGIYPEERKLGQNFSVCVTIFTDDKNDEYINDLNDTIDYTKIYDEIKNIMENNQYNLLEDCANTIIKTILYKFDLVIGLKVIIKKSKVHLKATFNYIAVEMERFR